MNEIIIILDESGSMIGLRDTTIKSVHQFIDENKSDNTRFTIVKFNNEVSLVYESVRAEEVDFKYFPSNMTALYDAIGVTFDNAGKRFDAMEDSKKPEKVLVAIITDGIENASKEFVLDDIREKIKHQREKYNWEVLFLGANMDAEEYGQSLGIQYNATYSANEVGTRSAYSSMSKAANSFTTQGVVLDNWNSEVK